MSHGIVEVEQWLRASVPASQALAAGTEARNHWKISRIIELRRFETKQGV